jgi:hypothetical protein
MRPITSAAAAAAWHTAAIRPQIWSVPGGPVGQLLDLAGDRGKAVPLFARASRLDGRVQRQHPGLTGDGRPGAPLRRLIDRRPQRHARR